MKEPRFQGTVSEARSRQMSQIKGKNTSIELMLRKALWARGYRYRVNFKEVPGHPDIAITKYKLAVFCDGEFFHGYDWESLSEKIENGSNPGYWKCKIERNMKRDHEKNCALRALGWTVIRFWGKDIMKNPDECVRVIEETIFELKMNSLDEDFWG